MMQIFRKTVTKRPKRNGPYTESGSIATALIVFSFFISTFGALVGSRIINRNSYRTVTEGQTTLATISVNSTSYDWSSNVFRVQGSVRNNSGAERYIAVILKLKDSAAGPEKDYITSEVARIDQQIQGGMTKSFNLGLSMTQQWEDNDCPAITNTVEIGWAVFGTPFQHAHDLTIETGQCHQPTPTPTPAPTTTPTPTDSPADTPTPTTDPSVPTNTPTPTPTDVPPDQCPADPYPRDEELNNCSGDPFSAYPSTVDINVDNYPASVTVSWSSVDSANGYRLGVFYYLCSNSNCGSPQSGNLAGFPHTIQENEVNSTRMVIYASEFNQDALDEIENGLAQGKILKLSGWVRALHSQEPNPPLSGGEDETEVNNRCFCRSDLKESNKEPVEEPGPTDTPTPTPSATPTPTPTEEPTTGGNCYGTLSGKTYVKLGDNTFCRVIDGLEYNFCVDDQSACTSESCAQQARELMRQQASECTGGLGSLDEDQTVINCEVRFEAGQCTVSPPEPTCDDNLPQC